MGQIHSEKGEIWAKQYWQRHVSPAALALQAIYALRAKLKGTGSGMGVS